MIKLERAVVEVFGGCNYSCKMCPQSTGRETNFLKKMPLELFKDTIEFMFWDGVLTNFSA